jgi:protein phosphatase 2C family protein 2/3
MFIITFKQDKRIFIMNNISQVSPSNFSTLVRGGFSRLSNRYVLAAIAALALVAVAYIALRTFAPNALSRFSLRFQQTPNTTPISTPNTTPISTPNPTPMANPTPKSADEGRSEALLADLLSTTLLKNDNEKLKLINQARAFAATVRQESNLDARLPLIIGTVPEITAPENGDWLSLTVRVMSGWSSRDKDTTIEVESGNAGRHPVQFASSEGPRDEMEDEHIAATLQYPAATDPIGLVGVFDGHGGAQASKFMKDHIEEYLSQEIQANVAASPLDNEDDLYAGCILALHNAFLKIDEAFSKEIDPKFKDPLSGGTTAIVGLIVHDKVIVANLGDCRAILIRHGQPIPMTVDAEPHIQRYLQQVEALGGSVRNGRIFGLATPAAIGDHNISYGNAGRKCIINVPEISIFDYEPGDKIVMACDGLWDALSSNKVAETITKRPGSDVVPADISDAVLLTRQALLTPGQNDNVTVAIVDLIQR